MHFYVYSSQIYVILGFDLTRMIKENNVQPGQETRHQYGNEFIDSKLFLVLKVISQPQPNPCFLSLFSGECFSLNPTVYGPQNDAL